MCFLKLLNCLLKAGEIKSYLKSQGANITETLSEKGIQEDLYEILQAVGVVWKDQEEQGKVGCCIFFISVVTCSMD